MLKRSPRVVLVIICCDISLKKNVLTPTVSIDARSYHMTSVTISEFISQFEKTV